MHRTRSLLGLVTLLIAGPALAADDGFMLYEHSQHGSSVPRQSEARQTSVSVESSTTVSPGRAIVAHATHLRSTATTPRLTKAQAQRRLALSGIVAQAAHQHGLPPALVDAVILAESGYSTTALSRAGAAGLMQLMPQTAAALGVQDRFDPWQNIWGGVSYLRQMIDATGSTPLGIAAYNAGPAAVLKRGRIPRNGETPAYVTRVLDLWADGAASNSRPNLQALNAHPSPVTAKVPRNAPRDAAVAVTSRSTQAKPRAGIAVITATGTQIVGLGTD